jgi:hypothetical protein
MFCWPQPARTTKESGPWPSNIRQLFDVSEPARSTTTMNNIPDLSRVNFNSKKESVMKRFRISESSIEQVFIVPEDFAMFDAASVVAGYSVTHFEVMVKPFQNGCHVMRVERSTAVDYYVQRSPENSVEIFSEGPPDIVQALNEIF